MVSSPSAQLLQSSTPTVDQAAVAAPPALAGPSTGAAWVGPLEAARWTAAARAAAMVAVALLFLLHLGHLTFVDPDLFHEMALFRESLRLGRLPLDDQFAYTPTVYPSVHHEWGTGAILYLVTQTAGSAGLMALKYALTTGVVLLVCGVARLRGAAWEVILLLAPVTVLTGVIGFTTVRAQLFTLLLLAVLLWFFERDRAGHRRWIWLWLPLYIVWLNLHAGFVVGLVWFGLYTIEQWWRGQAWRHLAATALPMALLVVVNPYGWLYYPYLAQALSLDRPLITEWAPLWEKPAMFQMFLLSLLMLVYAAARLGVRRMAGLAIVLVTAYAAARHTRHLSLYLLVWLAYVPGYVQQTPLGEAIEGYWRRRRRWVALAWTLVAAVCLPQVVAAQPWKLRVPSTPADEALGMPVYPVAAVEHLKRTGFRGNLMVPFVPGGYVSWHLHPRVKVSLDGRYEVAYQPGVLEENMAFYDAAEGWKDTLARYPTDLVLVPRSAKVAALLSAWGGWSQVYQDEAYLLFAAPPPENSAPRSAPSP